MIQINSDWTFGLDHSQLELIRIDTSDWIEMHRIDFYAIVIEWYLKLLPDVFGMIRNGLKTDLGIIYEPFQKSFEFRSKPNG